MTANKNYVRDIDVVTLHTLYDGRPLSPSGYYFDATGNWSIPTVSPGSVTLTNTHILVGNASNVAADVAMSGDATLANTGALTLANSGVSAGSYGSATQTVAITFDAKGRATSAANVSIQIAESQVTNLVTDLGNKQPLDATLTSLSALGTTADKIAYTTGIDTWAETTLTSFARTILDDTDAATVRATIGAGTGNGTVTSVNLTAPAAGITVSGGPITSSGSITLALANDLAALEGLTGTGLAVRTADATWALRTITGTASQIDVANGDGVSGAPTLSISSSYVPANVSTANEATDTTCFPTFVTASGTQTLPLKTNTTLKFNSNTGAFGAPLFVANTVTPEATVLDVRDSSAASTTYAYTAFAWFAGSSSASIDFEHTNSSVGAAATVDHTWFMDDQTHYCGIGQASKNYNVAGSTAVGGYDSYWYNQLNSLAIIAYAASQHIDFCTGGGNTANIRARASDSGFHVYGATTYMPIVGPTASNGAVQSVATGSATGQPLTYQGSSSKPIFETISAMGAVQSIGNSSSTTPSDAAGTATDIVVNNSGAQANTIISGSASGFSATAATRPSIQYNASGYIDVNFECWWNGATTSPYYYIAIYVGGTLKARIDFLNNSGYYNPVSIAWAGSYTANQEIKIMLGQTNGTARATTVPDYQLVARWRKYN